MANFKAKAKDYQLTVNVKLSFSEKLDEEDLDNFSRQYVRGVLKANKKNKKKIEYTGPVGISLYDRLKKPMSKYDFYFIMEQFVDLYQKMVQARLNINNIVPDLKNIYINEQTKEVQFIYLPLKSSNPNDIREIMLNIIYIVKPLEEDTSYISRFSYFLKSMKNFEAERIERFIAKEDKRIVNIIKKHNVGNSGFMTDKQKDYYEHYDRDEDDEATGLLGDDDEATGLLMEDDEATGLLTDEDEATGLLIDDDEATGLLIDDDEATGLLIDDNFTMNTNRKQNVKYATLSRVSTNEMITINKNVFRIGKEGSYSDYKISNNAVSRNHADIVVRGEKVYIMDLNSTNKTFLNDLPILPRQEVELHDGDSIKFANEEFIFHL